jgi:signal transduction histidine kinase
VEFSPLQSKLRFDLRRDGDSARLCVSNDGPPLPAEMQDRLFQSMVSVRETQSQAQPHLGLGLYIVRLIAEFHGANASARNREDGEGVEVIIDFPIAPNPIA